MVKVGEDLAEFFLRIARTIALRQKCPFTVLEFASDHGYVRVLYDNAVEDIIPVVSMLPSEEEGGVGEH